ncbi:outer membrane protein assembly factor BamB family protein [Cellulomonas chitinilytica]|nr:PQQ-binding-like beta-propeller repeat protein [Cellulomonas chitinilytica]
MARRQDLQDVELVEAEDDLAEAPPGAPTGPPTARSARRRWLVAGALLTVAVVAVAVNQRASTASEDAAVARLAKVPGVLAPVDDSLQVVRRLTQDDLAELAETSGGVLRRAADGSLSYRWSAPGSAGWTTQLLPPDPGLADGVLVRSASACETDEIPMADPASAFRAVCLVADGGTVYGEDGAAIATVPTTAVSVVVLSVADGSVETRWPVPSGDSLALMPGGLVVVGGQVGTSAVATGYDMLTGAERWRYEQDSPVVSGGPGTAGPGVSVYRAGDVVAFVPPDRTHVLLSTDGAPVRSGLIDPDASSWGAGKDPRTGRLVITEGSTRGSTRSTYVAPDGDPAGDLVTDGRPLYAALDDGSVPDRVLTADDDAVHGTRLTTGTSWSVHVDTPGSALVLRGRVLVSGAHGITAVDGASGRVLWRTVDEPGLRPGVLMTDGRHVLVAFERAGPDAVAALVALDPATGAEVFRAPYPAGVEQVAPLGRHLTGTDADGEPVLLE